MSYPRNSDIPSVNQFISSSDFPTEWGTFADAARLILSLPPGCEAATFDISAAYRLTPVRPEQQNALCLYWDGKVIVDKAVCFGVTSSAGVFGSVADMLVAIYKKWGVRGLLKWVDDFFAIRFLGETWTESEFISLTAAFGVPWGLKKTRGFWYISFIWDLVRKVVSLPEDKLAAIKELVKVWQVKDALFTEKKALSLHGKLVHTSSIYPLIRPFIRSSSQFAHSFLSHHAQRGVPHSMQNDLSWIQWLLAKLPNEVALASPDPIDIGWWGDASSSFGVGIVLGHYWAAWKWAPGFRVGPKASRDIGWAEAVAVELTLRGQLQLGLHKLHPPWSTFLVRSDNNGVVYGMKKGCSRSEETNKILKQVYALMATSHLLLHPVYIESRSNISDSLSRGDIAGFLQGFPSVTTRLSIKLPDHLAGLMIPVSL